MENLTLKQTGKQVLTATIERCEGCAGGNHCSISAFVHRIEDAGDKLTGILQMAYASELTVDHTVPVHEDFVRTPRFDFKCDGGTGTIKLITQDITTNS